MANNLIAGFVASAEAYPLRPALEVDGQTYNYRDLDESARHIQSSLSTGKKGGTVALLADRSHTTYAGIIGILRAGKAYVPLNAGSPAERNRAMLAVARPSAIVVGEECLHLLPELFPDGANKTKVIVPSVSAAAAAPIDTAESWTEYSPPGTSSFVEVDEDDSCYVIFTSGSTGTPKGVVVRHRNAKQYVAYMRDLYPATHNDRFSQVADVSFDQSVQDMFSAWECGACLYCIPKKEFLSVGNYIQSRALTVWNSVPSITNFLVKTNSIGPAAFPSFRWCTFAGEAVSYKFAKLWQEAAINAEVGVLYGPTEATVSCTYYPMPKGADESIAVHGIMPIGWPLGESQAKVVDSQLHEVADGESGELCIGGKLVTAGYMGDEEKTRNSFVEFPDSALAWYRTGDVVRRSRDGRIDFLGRNDTQIKIHGYRVELAEIEMALRKASGALEAAAIPWPVEDGKVAGIRGFVVLGEGATLTSREIIRRCRQLLPIYMVPKRVVVLELMPQTANGKVDRQRLTALLEADAGAR